MDNVATTCKPIVIVFGAFGLLGATLCPILEMYGYQVIKQSRGHHGDICCDPTKKQDVAHFLNLLQPSAVVNLIALSNVDTCETNLRTAYQTNVHCVETIASAIMEISLKPHLIQISTDHLYQGDGPHDESSASPINLYALTKFTGELVASKVGATVLRTNFFGKSRHHDRQSFSDWIYESLASKREFTVFDDVYFSALNMETLSVMVAKAIEAKKAGVYNLGAHDGISKAVFAKKFAAFLDLDTSQMRIGSHRDVKLTAPRPTDMRLDVARFERSFQMTLPHMDSQIQEAAHSYKGELK
jgi:dTDP-4-dehydrorhamnose reductase